MYYMPQARKDTSQIFNNLIHKNIHNFTDYIHQNFYMVSTLVEGYSVPEIALLCGTMIRECIRYEELTKCIIESDQFWLFFDNFVHLPNFDVASDAFNTLRELLVKNKTIAAQFLDSKYSEIFEKYEVRPML